MANSRRGRQRLKYDDWHYFEQLPPEIRKALWEGPQEWSSCSILTVYKRALKAYGRQVARTKVLAAIEMWNRNECRETGDIATMQRYQ